ncbi:mannose-1-phosphate guanylyltransferase [Paenibacillus sp. SSG-1]|uniref:sugar phosphate nucleotidyltransferase n=1 Tax=Paenibacillus sp. SSG-1 TaxID=1443669 RepID=UPI000B7F4708|nr:sugar phosphate nucleotidyltransferase [Paenibacillus sp. SSG-1]OXL82137.1 mannose-1-phosphate guanylyltransferase [Paenibacillus sp. SSG-1]
MKIVLLSGGSGKRLWPLSNDARSKQFLRVLETGSGERISMLQRVWDQLAAEGLGQDSCIATSKGQVDMIQSQIGSEAEIVIEPEKRDTFPAIALAASYLYSMKDMPLDEVMIVMPVDPFVEQPFFNRLRKLERVVQTSGADLALLGVLPTYPSEKYGYIVPENIEDNNSEYVQVHSFREKPREEEAADMIRQGALWNCGVFAFRLGFIIDMLIERKLPIHYEEAVRQYGRFLKTSFDYEVVEKTEQIVVMPYDGEWKDLGTWNTLTEEIASPLIGKGTLSPDSQNTHVINELDIPVTAIGVSNLIIAVSPDGILVSDKEASPRIKELVNSDELRPMVEERRWGRYRVLDFLKYEDGQEVLTKRICIQAGKNLSYQYHHKRKEVWTVIAGSGEMILDGQYRRITTGDVIVIPAQSKHSLKAATDMEIIEVQTGTELVEEDIVRLAMRWEEILQFCFI